MDFQTIIALSKEIREKYHELEKFHHGSEWSIEEDALAFLTDAGLVGRLTMAHQKRWPTDMDMLTLEHKLGECIWWLIVMADRMEIDIEMALKNFLEKTKKQLGA